MKPFHHALILSLILAAAGRVAAQPTVIRPAPYPAEPRLFLFVVDTSSGMKRQAPSAGATVASLLGNGAQGRMRRGDLYCVWTFQDTVTTNLMAWERWQPELAPALGSTAAKLLENVRHSGRPSQDDAVKAFVQLARDARELTVFLLNDGSEVLYGTPFDLPVSTIYIEHGKKLAADRRPFVTTLVARNGEIRAWSVDAAGLAINIPTLPDETPPAPVSTPAANTTAAPPPPKPEPPKPQPLVAKVEPAPVKPAPKVEPSPPPVQTPKAEPAPPPKSSPVVSTTATPPKPATPPVKTEPPVVEPPKTASIATNPTPPAPKPGESKPPVTPPQPAPLPAAGVAQTAPPIPSAPPAAVTNAPPQPLPSPAPVATVETAPASRTAETNAAATSPVEPPPAPAADTAKVAPAQTAVMLPPQPGSSTALYLAFGLGLLVAAGVIGFFVLLRRQRAAAGGSLISESLDREQREASGTKPRPRKSGID